VSETIATPGRDATVLLATKDGARHLMAQLDSIAAQSDWGRIDLVASDDGSSDGTLTLLAEAAAKWRRGRFEVVTGPGRGFAENFRSLLQREATTPFVAFSDQDDIWLASKLSVAAGALGDAESPALYCGRTLLVSADDRPMGMSPLFTRQAGFANALVQSIAGANTMVLNRAGFALARQAALRSGFVSHDWLCYQIVSGAGGRVVYDPVPQVRYRQHGENLVGANTGWRARLDRLRRAWGGRFVDWNDRNVATLTQVHELLTPEARERLAAFDSARHGALGDRLRRLRQSGVYRQTLGGQVSLWAAAVLGKL
jgi:glycosyltransferase involved in cell wall biosynthesis